MSSNHTLKQALLAIATDGADDNGRTAGYSVAELAKIAREATEQHEAKEKRDAEKHEQLMEIGRSAYASIAKMVAALDCDYDRLEELREERAELAAAIADAENEHNEAEAGSDEAEANALDEARSALAKWDEEHGKELKELSDAAGDCKDRDEAYERIQEDPLSIEVRGGWHTPGEDDNAPVEFRILLATGGPAVRIIGELDGNKEPSSARLQVQDWFTPWTDYLEADGETLLTYCRCFYFGE